MEINDLVRRLLEQHGGGTVFFDHLDAAVQQEPIVDRLVSHLSDNPIIVSGGFGRFFVNYAQIMLPSREVVLVNGGLRHGRPIDNLSYLDLEGKNFLFVDDSFYKGRTRDVVEEELNRNNATLLATYVIYDGSKTRERNVHSLFRYNDG